METLTSTISAMRDRAAVALGAAPASRPDEGAPTPVLAAEVAAVDSKLPRQQGSASKADAVAALAGELDRAAAGGSRLVLNRRKWVVAL